MRANVWHLQCATDCSMLFVHLFILIFYDPYFTNVETEVQRDQVTSLMSYNYSNPASWAPESVFPNPILYFVLMTNERIVW